MGGDRPVLRIRRDDTSYSDLVRISGQGDWIFVAGQLAFDDRRRLVGSTVAEQADICFDRIASLLGEAGGDLTDVVRITTYLTDLDHYPDFDSVRARRFGDHRPTSAAVKVAGLLFGALIEIEAVAFVASPQATAG